MKEKIENFSTQKELYKEAVEEIETILLRMEGQDNNAIAFIQDTLEKLLNGELTSIDALRRVKKVSDSLSIH
jgi:predicted component of type VI protein secretion system